MQLEISIHDTYHHLQYKFTTYSKWHIRQVLNKFDIQYDGYDVKVYLDFMCCATTKEEALKDIQQLVLLIKKFRIASGKCEFCYHKDETAHIYPLLNVEFYPKGDGNIKTCVKHISSMNIENVLMAHQQYLKL